MNPDTHDDRQAAPMTPIAAPSAMKVASALALLLVLMPTSPLMAIDADLLAHRLYAEGRAAEAAEIFTDPAWKGVALYRSGQWWRAADAFVRADDAQSAHNLGNCYVKLGYYALALGAYRRALATDPTLEDARYNAALMVRLLEEQQDDDGASGRTTPQDEIERIASEQEPESGSGGDSEAGEESDERGESAPGASEDGSTSREGSERAETGDGGEAGDERREQPEGEGSGSLGGEVGEHEAANRASGMAESDRAREDSEAAGSRNALESEQATEQWLNRIAHDPARFLARRIALEIRRRRAAGQSAPEGGSTW